MKWREDKAAPICKKPGEVTAGLHSRHSYRTGLREAKCLTHMATSDATTEHKPAELCTPQLMVKHTHWQCAQTMAPKVRKTGKA